MTEEVEVVKNVTFDILTVIAMQYESDKSFKTAVFSAQCPKTKKRVCLRVGSADIHHSRFLALVQEKMHGSMWNQWETSVEVQYYKMHQIHKDCIFRMNTMCGVVLDNHRNMGVLMMPLFEPNPKYGRVLQKLGDHRYSIREDEYDAIRFILGDLFFQLYYLQENIPDFSHRDIKGNIQVVTTDTELTQEKGQNMPDGNIVVRCVDGLQTYLIDFAFSTCKQLKLNVNADKWLDLVRYGINNQPNPAYDIVHILSSVYCDAKDRQDAQGIDKDPWLVELIDFCERICNRALLISVDSDYNINGLPRRRFMVPHNPHELPEDMQRVVLDGSALLVNHRLSALTHEAVLQKQTHGDLFYLLHNLAEHHHLVPSSRRFNFKYWGQANWVPRPNQVRPLCVILQDPYLCSKEKSESRPLYLLKKL